MDMFSANHDREKYCHFFSPPVAMFKRKAKVKGEKRCSIHGT